VFHVRGGWWFVRDLAEGHGNHLLETFWHFAPDLEVREERGIVLVDPHTAGARLALLVDHDSAWISQIGEGFVSPAYGSKETAPVVRISANVSLPEECGTLLLPMVKNSEAGTLTAIAEGSGQGVRGYRYQALQTAEFLFFATGDEPWTCGGWSSDAKLLYCKLEGSRFAHVIMVNGSFAEWRRQRFVSHPSESGAFEWVSRSGAEKSYSADGNTGDGALLADFEVFDSV
jgi:hypothetical protein